MLKLTALVALGIGIGVLGSHWFSLGSTPPVRTGVGADAEFSDGRPATTRDSAIVEAAYRSLGECVAQSADHVAVAEDGTPRASAALDLFRAQGAAISSAFPVDPPPAWPSFEGSGTAGSFTPWLLPGSEEAATRLVAAGFTQERAERIQQRYAELVAETVEFESSVEAYARTADARLRSELGDAEFERYLTALGLRADVEVLNVVAASPAESIGMRPGDRIVAYDGQRVFDHREIRSMTLQNPGGRAVLIDILREGQPMQVVAPGGTLGVTLASELSLSRRVYFSRY